MPVTGAVPQAGRARRSFGAGCDACGALAEGDATWVNGDECPTQALRDRELEQLRTEMAQATSQMVQWRLSLARSEGIQYDRFQYAVVVAIDDLTYHGYLKKLAMFIGKLT